MAREQNMALRTALADAIEGSAYSPTSLGRAIERGPDYVRDFLNGRKASLGAAAIADIERQLQLAAGSLLRFAGGSETPSKPVPIEPNVRRSDEAPNLKVLARSRGPKVPVFGIAVGGSKGDFRLNGETINWLPRPAAIADAKGVYALYVSNDSMVPLYKSGDPLYVDPHRAASIGDCVVIELHPDEDGSPGDGFVKQLVRRSGSTIIVEQFNPPEQLTFSSTEVKAVHRVIPWRELLGL